MDDQGYFVKGAAENADFKQNLEPVLTVSTNI